MIKLALILAAVTAFCAFSAPARANTAGCDALYLEAMSADVSRAKSVAYGEFLRSCPRDTRYAQIKADRDRLVESMRHTIGGVEAEVRTESGKCKLVVNAKAYIDGKCDIVIAQDGSFAITDKRHGGIEAMVRRGGFTGVGSWRRSASQAYSDLGTVHRNCACWDNDNARICAWGG